jgi:hypothetical protein
MPLLLPGENPDGWQAGLKLEQSSLSSGKGLFNFFAVQQPLFLHAVNYINIAFYEEYSFYTEAHSAGRKDGRICRLQYAD